MERVSPQIVVTSTAHRKATSLMRGRISDSLAMDSSLLLLWSVPDDADTSELSTWMAASAHWSPARERLMQSKWERALRGEQDDELDDPDPLAGFESQYLNRWQLKVGAGGALPGWSDLATDRIPPEAEALGVASDVSGSWFSLGAFGEDFVAPVLRWRAENGVRRFIEQVSEIAVRRGLPVAVGEKGAAGFMIRDLEDAGVYVIPTSFNDFVQASADFADAVETGMITHGAMPELDSAVIASRWRLVGDRRALDTRGSDVSMLEAVALARLLATGSLAQQPAIF